MKTVELYVGDLNVVRRRCGFFGDVFDANLRRNCSWMHGRTLVLDAMSLAEKEDALEMFSVISIRNPTPCVYLFS